jgi:tetratricopeptide (TPR) repeat protein
LLQAASVIGTDVPLDLLHAVVDEGEAALRQGLARLQASEFLYETRLFPELEYTFKHALTHEVTYGSLLHERRRPLHARIVEAIERLYPDRLTEHAERLAYHAVKGELTDKAVTYLQQAGRKAFGRSAHREAAGYFEQALATLSSASDVSHMVERAIDIRIDLRGAIFPLGEIERGLTYLREAETLARQLDDPRRLGWISAYTTNQVWMTGDSTKATAFGEQALAIAEKLGDRQLQLVATHYMGSNSFTRGEYRLTEELFQRIADWVADDPMERCGMTGFPAGISRAYIAWSLAERGEFRRAITVGQEAIVIADRLDHPWTMMWARYGLVNSYLIKGDLEPALGFLERMHGLMHDWSLGVWAAFLPWATGWAHMLSGHEVEAAGSLEQTLTTRDTLGIQNWQPLVLVHAAEACLASNRSGAAQGYAERALALARERGERGHEAYALRILGEIAARRDPAETATAATHYDTALALATALGMRPLIAHCHLGLGKLYRRRDRREQAHEHLATATTMYREMGMTYWLEKAEQT